MEWISITQATALTGKTERTIRRWFKANKSNISATKKVDGKIYINSTLLHKDYPPVMGRQNTGEDKKIQKEALQIATNAKSIESITVQLEAKDKQIEKLMVSKGRVPLLLTLAFLFSSLLIGAGLYFAFVEYRSELERTKKREIQLRTENFNAIILGKNSIIEDKNENLLILKQQNAQQRQELAQKDRLISELYNDTKAQNKKLLELTENIKNEAIKNEKEENGLRGKEAQK